MKKNQAVFLIGVVLIFSILLAACSSPSTDVPSLVATPVPDERQEPEIDAEEKMFEFTQCLRDQGVEVEEPTVNAAGNIQKPEFADGMDYSREDVKDAWNTCEYIIEGITFGRESRDLSDKADYFVELVICLNEAGFDLDEPTATTLETWLKDFRVVFDWEDEDAAAAYEECSGENIGDGGRKGKADEK